MMLVGEDERRRAADFSKTFGAARAPHAHTPPPAAQSLCRCDRDGSLLPHPLLPVRPLIYVCLPE